MSPKLAALLTQARTEARLTQQDLAIALDVARPTITRIESGDRDTTVEKLEAWVDRCGWMITIMRQDPEDLMSPLQSLDVTRLRLAQRLLRLLPALDEAHLISLDGLLQAWERVKSSDVAGERPRSKAS